jgi:predicted nucleic acid-binding protein
MLTAVVQDEIIPGARRAGESEIGTGIERKRLRVIDDECSTPQFPEFDEGGASMLRAAVNLRVLCPLPIDERAGTTVARELGFAVTGTVGIIVAVRRRTLIPAVRPVFEQLLDRDFRISVYQECGEG